MRFLRENTSFIKWNIPFGGETLKLGRGLSLDETNSVSSGLTVRETLPQDQKWASFCRSLGAKFLRYPVDFSPESACLHPDFQSDRLETKITFEMKSKTWENTIFNHHIWIYLYLWRPCPTVKCKTVLSQESVESLMFWFKVNTHIVFMLSWKAKK